MSTQSLVLSSAQAYLDAGFSPIPVKLDGTKSPTGSWSRFQTYPPTSGEVQSMFTPGPGIAVVAGKVSQFLEAIDIDSEDLYEPFIKALEKSSSREFIESLCIIKSPRPGYQIWYRCPSGIEAGKKLAMSKDGRKTLIESRGEGNYLIAPGSPARVHKNNVEYQVISGDHLDPPIISAAERELLIQCAKSFHQQKTSTQPNENSDNFDKRYNHIIQEYNESSTWQEILESNGFVRKRIDGFQEHYQKPDSSNSGEHLTTNHEGKDLLWCFSTSCPPFEENRYYNKFQTYSLLNHGGKNDEACLELLRQGHGWKEQKPLMRVVPPSEVFPVEALGPILGDAAREMAKVIQAPLAICCQSVLAAASLAVQGHGNIVIDGRSSPLSEFFLSIAPSGERKSAVDKSALAAHRDFQEKLREQYKAKELEYRNSLEVYECSRKNILKGKEEAGKKKSSLDKLGQPPKRPPSPIMFVEEPTYEGLVKLLEDCLPSIGVFSDEGGRFIGGHAMNKDNVMKTVAGFNGMWDGMPITRSRAQDGNSVLHGRRVSMHLLMQPAVSQQLFSNNLILDQGLLSRCLISWPESTAGSRKYRETNLGQQPAIIAFNQRMSRICERDLPTTPDAPQELKPREISLSSEAKKAWIEFHNENERDLAPEMPFESIRGFANKAPEHAARLAGVISLFENIDSSVVSEQHIKSAILLAKYYRSEALRLFHSGALEPDLVLAQMLLDWLKKNSKNEIALTEIYQKGPSAIRQAATSKRLMRILIDHGWAIEITGLTDAELKGKEAFRIRMDKDN